jgi:protein ATS1
MPLYALGSNSSYQLSLGHINDVSAPSLTTLRLPQDERPIKIVAGANHTLLLTNSGRLYTTGANKYGQCLRPPCDVIPGFTQVDGVWDDCAATWEGSIAIDKDGALWSFGSIKNHDNLCGIRIDHSIATEADDGTNFGKSKFKHVFGGVQHFIAIGDGEAFGYGEGRKGQLGAPTLSSKAVKIPLNDVVQAACGKDFSCLLSAKESITVYTTSLKHNLRSIPTCTSIKSINASWSTIAILHDSGEITSWGRSDHSQLHPPNLPPISQLAAGSEHFVALASNNKVYSWGWNEHGNCGLETREDVTFINELRFPEDERPTYVAAGCGTSWVWTEAR